ncbi:hypothetical protein [Micromonospora echinofusca]|uniref:hypothetical protein n=1 Tax=Micromonospora echinofusca TaxID=47858 RepID=UPI0033E792C1
MWEIPTEAELDAVVELDWDVAGPWSAAEELAATVAEWTEILEDQPRKELAADLLRGYAAAGGTLPAPEPGLFTTWLVKQVNWTMLLARRSLDASCAQAEPPNDLDHLMRRLRRAPERLPVLLDLLACHEPGKPG